MIVKRFDALKGHDFIACGKHHLERHEVSGHDFSSAENAAK
jgi:hypothetical protein